MKQFVVLFVYFMILMVKLSRSSESHFVKVEQNINNRTLLTITDHNFESNQILTWILSILGALLVGLSGILPYAIIPQLAQNHEELLKRPIFKYLVTFAAGSLLGDVYLHLLPETYSLEVLKSPARMLSIGYYTLLGLLSFMTIEKLFPDKDDDENTEAKEASMIQSSFFYRIKTIGYLNMLANIFDNFTHGIAVAGSFQTSIWSGLMTLFATLLHEIPHEIGDFAVLLRSGFSYRRAVRAQLGTALVGIAGALFALYFSTSKQSTDASAQWILPFTSGGFLYISLVGIIPDLIQEKDFNISCKMILSLICGIILIYFLTLIFD